MLERLYGVKIAYIIQAEMATEKTKDLVSNGLTMIGQNAILAHANVMTDGIRTSRNRNSIAQMERRRNEHGSSFAFALAWHKTFHATAIFHYPWSIEYIENLPAALEILVRLKEDH